ncbi:MAG: DUF1634 domain-containing protein [Bacteroidota bacterium]
MKFQIEDAKLRKNGPGSNQHLAEKTERLISRALLSGVLLSSFIMLYGLILYFSGHTVHPVKSPSMSEVIVHFHPLDSTSVLFMGVIVLMLTPVVRVILAIVGFAKEGEGRFVLVSIGVLLILLFSMMFSIG